MSDYGEIRASVEAIDRVVRDFAKDIGDFRTDVDGKLQAIDAALDRLNDAWNDEMHRNFDEKMKMRQSSMRAALQRTEKLEEKLNEIAAEMSTYLMLLQSAGAEE